MAGVAALDSNVGEAFRRVDGKLSVVFLAATWADNAAEFPFGKAKAAEQATASTIALLAKDGDCGFAVAAGAQGKRVALDL